MSGIYVEKLTGQGYEAWIVRDVNTRVAVAVGSTINQAVQNYEASIENERMARQLGVSLDDLDV